MRLSLVMYAVLLIVALGVDACVSERAQAPIVAIERGNSRLGDHYKVAKGDTLYSIAWETGIDYRQLVRANRLTAPYHVSPGQVLSLLPVDGEPLSQRGSVVPVHTLDEQGKEQVIKTYESPDALRDNNTSVRENNSGAHTWVWPTKGKIISYFSNTYKGNMGVDIGGAEGQDIRAAADGIVVYCGARLRGYGKLIIVKHSTSELSAYGYNQSILVTMGARVRAGQVIARMGKNPSGHPALHFEVRKNGRPIDPTQLFN